MEQQARELAKSVLDTENIRLQTEYMGTCRTRITVCEDQMGAFFSKYSQVEDMKAIIIKFGIATGDMELQ